MGFLFRLQLGLLGRSRPLALATFIPSTVRSRIRSDSNSATIANTLNNRMSLMGTTKKRKTYTPEYRREAARLVIDTGRPIVTVAAEINVGAQLLGRWVQLERDRMGAPPEAPLDVSERAELERLRAENADLRLDNEFLGKAAAFFAAKNTPGRSASR